MKLEKVTKRSGSTTRRWYDDACGTALALEFVGERWALLIMRELMYGPRRFGELRAMLPGISANVLSQRLDGMEAVGILTRRRLPSPANAQVYELTPWGYQSAPIYQELGRWAVRSSRHDPTLFLSPASAMMSLQTMVAKDADRPAMTVGIRFPDDMFVATLDAHRLDIRREEPGAVDLLFDCDVTSFARIVYGDWPIAEAEAAGALRFEGDRTLAARFLALFTLPDKIA